MSNCQAVRSYIENIIENDFYTITFVKKTDGSIRKMNCRQGIKKYSKGGVNPCAGKEDLMPTYSMDAKGYRTISLANVIEISHNGSVIKF